MSIKTTTNTRAFLAAVNNKAETALGVVAGKVVVSARRIVPVKTGALKASIRVVQDGLTAHVGSDIPYAAHVEAGTATQSAQPYLRPALMENLPAIKRAFGAV